MFADRAFPNSISKTRLPLDISIHSECPLRQAHSSDFTLKRCGWRIPSNSGGIQEKVPYPDIPSRVRRQNRGLIRDLDTGTYDTYVAIVG